jgi:hypothetical protein
MAKGDQNAMVASGKTPIGLDGAAHTIANHTANAEHAGGKLDGSIIRFA